MASFVKTIQNIVVPQVVDMGGYTLDSQNQANQHHVSRRTDTVNPESTSLGLGSKVSFRIKPGMHSRPESTRLRIALTETGGVATAQTWPSHRLIVAPKISFNGREASEIVLHKDYLADVLGFRSDNEFNLLQEEMNFSSLTTYASATNIAASETKYFYINLNSTVLNKINYRAISGDVVFVFDLQPTLVVAGAGVLAYTEVRLEFDVNYSEIADRLFLTSQQRVPHHIPYYDTISETINVTLTAGTRLQIPIRSITDSSAISLLTLRCRTADTLALSETMTNLDTSLIDLTRSSKSE